MSVTLLGCILALKLCKALPPNPLTERKQKNTEDKLVRRQTRRNLKLRGFLERLGRLWCKSSQSVSSFPVALDFFWLGCLSRNVPDYPDLRQGLGLPQICPINPKP